jgi:N-acetylglutamate synthase
VISIDELERAAAPGWRGIEEERLGDWLLRAAGGFTGRANSALAVGEPGAAVAAAARYVRDWYRARGLPAMIAEPYPAGEPSRSEPHRSELDGQLAALGWTLRPGPATVMIATVVAGDPAGVEIDSEPDAAWLARYHYRGTELPPVARRVLLSAPWQAFASVRRDGRTVAIGRVAGQHREAGLTGWAGLTAIEVDPDYRGHGLGTAVSAALAAAAARRGLHNMYLQVEDDNAAARALYAKIGFRDHHGYHYRVGPVSS